MCDVTNPLCGKTGASTIYGPQKGANEKDIQFLDQGLKHLVEICIKKGYQDYSEETGSGAAGGLGFGLMTFLNAKLQSGIETVLDVVLFCMNTSKIVILLLAVKDVLIINQCMEKYLLE